MTEGCGELVKSASPIHATVPSLDLWRKGLVRVGGGLSPCYEPLILFGFGIFLVVNFYDNLTLVMGFPECDTGH